MLFSDMPFDILIQTFHNLEFEQLIICSKVCRNFKLCIERNPCLFWYKNPIRRYRSLFQCGCIEKEIRDCFYYGRRNSDTEDFYITMIGDRYYYELNTRD